MIRQILIAFQFLTIIPVKTDTSSDESAIARSASLFVIVGLIQGIFLIAVDYGAGLLFHQEVVICLVILASVLSSGAFHIDGLSDTFDALAVRSSGDMNADRKRRLSVMKDSAAGPIGVAAIIFSLGLKYAALKNLSHFLPFIYYSALLFMPIFSKWAMVVSMIHGKAARQDGLGKIFVNKIGSREFAISTVLLILIIILLQTIASRYALENQYAFYAIFSVMLYSFCYVFVRFSNKKFGGLTGDTLGAVSELAEIIFLLAMITWSRLSI